MTQRDTTIDALRGAAMMYTVCVIHVVYWFGPTPEPLSSALLFEMPAIFFIAGAAQSLRRGPLPTLREMVAGRARRVLLPFAFFLPWLFLWLLLITAAEPSGSMFSFSIGSLAWTDFVKIMLTFGGDKIPYYQYTWFIPCYFVLLCSLPLQARLLRRLGRGFYIAAAVALAAGAAVALPSFHHKYIVMNVLAYNVFFMAGYLYYRRMSLRAVAAVALASVALTVADFAAGTAIPMQGHKFPPDLHFIAFGTAWLSVLSIALWRAKLPCRGLVALWNTHGYTIYLYQIIGAYATYRIASPWIGGIGSTATRHAILGCLMLATNTLIALCARLKPRGLFRTSSRNLQIRN